MNTSCLKLQIPYFFFMLDHKNYLF
ncbi:hypothetical protein NC652_039042 [Populus alba x Populus x berolinensis]|nr:hypothetical protein NC652_039042 [Populus alba x Populus x berolinensis]